MLARKYCIVSCLEGFASFFFIKAPPLPQSKHVKGTIDGAEGQGFTTVFNPSALVGSRMAILASSQKTTFWSRYGLFKFRKNHMNTYISLLHIEFMDSSGSK